ncbi:MAG: 1-(5-phosphoribosyl)-5-[(5-phosphoribosylamino)methylideneamino]imidazole-4-carboxamide isomerase [Deltaproteobacteria bacterium]|nr:1-(5-phosphoribosyl)-5-[(5-phosphoribosylamino)methylideneamino]imidazole-4-carboxamide isomerase [Deltaproteobacteria bacterium]
MIVIPAIDLKAGKCVRLKQGRMEDATVYGDEPGAMARHWESQGARRLHVVDLDGAFAGRPENLEAIRAIRAAISIPVELGGGVRDTATAERLLGEGIDFVILGTAALEDPGLVATLSARYPGRILVGIDARGGLVAVRGWAEVTAVKAVDLARTLSDAGAAGFVFTDIEKDGMQTGVSLEATAEFARVSRVPVIASGGVTDLDDIRRLKPLAALGVAGVITGRALYEGTLDLGEAQRVADEGA